MNAYSSSSHVRTQRDGDEHHPFGGLHWNGLFFEMYLFFGTFMCIRDPNLLICLVITTIVLFFFVRVLDLARPKAERAWNVSLAMASVNCIFLATWIVGRTIRNNTKNSGARGCCSTVFWFNVAATAFMAAVVSLTVTVNAEIIWIIMIFVSWLIFMALVLVVKSLVLMILKGPTQFDLMLERKQTFCSAMTLASILYTLVPCVNFEPGLSSFVCPLISLITALSVCTVTAEKTLKERMVLSSGLYHNSDIETVFVPLVITFPPFVLLISASFRLPSPVGLLNLTGFGFILILTAFISMFGLMEARRWYVVLAKDGGDIKQDGEVHNDVVLVVDEMTTTVFEYQVVGAYRGYRGVKPEQPSYRDETFPTVFYLADGEDPDVVMVSSSGMVKMCLVDPIGFIQSLEQALARAGHKSNTDALRDDDSCHQEVRVTETTNRKIL